MKRVLERSWLPAFFWASVCLAGPQYFQFHDGTRYRVLKEMGSGGFGVVYQVQKIGPGSGPYTMALKVFKPGHERGARKYDWIHSWMQQEQAPQWMQFGRSLEAFEVGEDQAREATVIPMELYDTSLASQAVHRYFDALQNPQTPVDEVLTRLHTLQSFTRQGSEALGSLLHFGVVHGDLKPDNFMLQLNGGRVDPDARQVLVDLDSIEPLGLGQGTYTPGFVAPEASRAAAEKKPLPPTNDTTDLYAYAGTIYSILFGRAPIVDFIMHIDPSLSEKVAERSSAAVLAKFAAKPEQYGYFLTYALNRFDEIQTRYHLTDQQASDLHYARNLVAAGLQLQPGARLSMLRQVLPDSPLAQALGASDRHAPPSACGSWLAWLGL